MTTLYIVATPIGNLGDMTYRAVETLAEVDLVLCEDTRVTKKLLDHYSINTPTMSYHANSKLSRTDEIISRLQSGENMALVSDAGTPCISDPGVQLLQEITRQDIDVQVVPIPGASALTALVSVAGMSGNQFVFMGFLPHKKGRQTMFAEIADTPRAVVFYESPHRIEKTLDALAEVLDDDREVVIGRELTKMHEQIVRGSATQVRDYFIANPDKVRGEFVVAVSGK